jgi:hypothetical protein
MGKIDKSTVFIPKDSSYSAFDVFYYDKIKDILFCIQITTDNRPITRVESMYSRSIVLAVVCEAKKHIACRLCKLGSG